MTKSRMGNKPGRYILLDSNIFQHLGNTALAEQIISMLRITIEKGYGIALSQYSLMELVDNASVDTEQKRLSATRGFKNFKVRQDVLIAAAHMGSLYKEDGLDQKQQPEIGDKIIGATAIIHNCLIYTTNGRDFPSPYFKEILRHYLSYKNNGRELVIMCYFMEPDLEAITKRYDHHTNSFEKTQLIPAKTTFENE